MNWLEQTQGKIDSAQDIINLFPQTKEAIQKIEKQVFDEINNALENFITQDPKQYSKETILHEFEQLSASFSSVASMIQITEFVHPDKEIREQAHATSLAMQEFAIEKFSNKKIYAVFKQYQEQIMPHEILSDEEKYGIEETMRDFILSGLDLPDAEFSQFQTLQKKAMQLALDFETNINTDNSQMLCTKEELEGMNPLFVDALERTEDSKYIIKTDYPTATELLSFCTVEKTREQFWMLFNNRAYPKNEAVLKELLLVRAKIAKMLGFKNYAELNICTKMAKNPARVRSFFESISKKAHKKATSEYEAWKKIKAENLSLSDDGKILPWNIAFIKKIYEREHFNFDERELRPYFSMEKTIQGIFDIYQEFLGLRFEISKPAGLWHEDVQMITAYKKDDQNPCGYIFLDLFPRANKYSHACHCDITKTVFLNKEKTEISKSAGLVIANFPKATKTEPSLLKHADVETFFHEFGHAMHHLLGTTELPRFSGTGVKWDFVEMPSQMLEEWVWKPAMIKKMSAHYETNEAIPDALIEKMIAKKKYDSGYFFCRQLMLADFSLTIYEQDEPDFQGLLQKLLHRYSPDIAYNERYHMHTAFGHLTNYAASYYGYMWSLVFACDIFDQLDKEGLTAQAGQRFAKMILSKGGSIDPEILLKDFLGRKPNEKAFFEAYDLR
jgi:thimet oligopeptidase